MAVTNWEPEGGDCGPDPPGGEALQSAGFRSEPMEDETYPGILDLKNLKGLEAPFWPKFSSETVEHGQRSHW